jgi:hypothetical protein
VGLSSVPCSNNVCGALGVVSDGNSCPRGAACLVHYRLDDCAGARLVDCGRGGHVGSGIFPNSGSRGLKREGNLHPVQLHLTSAGEGEVAAWGHHQHAPSRS